MKYYEIRQSDMTVVGQIDTSSGDIVATKSGHFMLGEPAIAAIVTAGGYATDREAFEANGYVWGIAAVGGV